MLRHLVAVALLALASPAITADAWAVTKEEVKEAKSTAKSVQKLATKWHKAQSKGKDTSAVHAKLLPYYKAELADLRQKGIPTKEKPTHPSAPPADKPDAPKMEELRDILVELRDAQVGPRKYGNLLDQYVQRLWERHQRKSNRYAQSK